MPVDLKQIIVWTPRILGLAFAGFLALFALDVFQENLKPATVAVAFAIHLIPAALVLAGVLIAWRHERVGAVIFLVLGLAYAVSARQHPSWILLIAGPAWLLAALFAASWVERGRSRGVTG